MPRAGILVRKSGSVEVLTKDHGTLNQQEFERVNRRGGYYRQQVFFVGAPTWSLVQTSTFLYEAFSRFVLLHPRSSAPPPPINVHVLVRRIALPPTIWKKRKQTIKATRRWPLCCVAQNTVVGKPRVYPGGLLVTRAFGDFSAKVSVLCGQGLLQCGRATRDSPTLAQGICCAVYPEMLSIETSCLLRFE